MKHKGFVKILGLILGIIGLLSEDDLHAKPKELTADIIVIGGGTAGCALVSKLSEKYKVILLEGGTDQSNNPLIVQPTNSGAVSLQINQFFWELGHWVGPNQTNPGAFKYFPGFAGKVLGGGSSINGLRYIRSTASYFAQIQKITGDNAWGPANVFQVYNDIENFNGISGQYNPAAHGFNGSLNIRQCALNTPAATVFANAAATVAAVPVIKDYNDPSMPIGAFVNWQLTENPDETRAQSFQAYLQGKVKRKSDNVYKGKNIIIYTNAKVEEILFSKDHTPLAKGVKALIDGTEYIFQAKKKIVLSAGFQSPVILQLSGVGPRGMLENAGIRVVFDNPNVGQTLFNHTSFTLTGAGALPMDPNPDPNNLYTGGAFLPDPTQPADTDRGFMWIGKVNAAATAFTITALPLNSKSLGSIGVISSDPVRMPIFQFNYYSNPADLTSAVACYGQAYNTLVQMGLTPLPGLPMPGDTAGVQEYILGSYKQVFDWVGTCAMGKSAETAVVDSSGNVFGVKNLVVADITISPITCRGNTQAIGFLIGNIIGSKILHE